MSNLTCPPIKVDSRRVATFIVVKDCRFGADLNQIIQCDISEVSPTDSQKTFHFPSSAKDSTITVGHILFLHFAPGSMAQNSPTIASTQQPTIIFWIFSPLQNTCKKKK